MSVNLTKPVRLRNDGGAQLQLERNTVVYGLEVTAGGVLTLSGALDATGRVGVGAASGASVALVVGGAITAGASQYGVFSAGTLSGTTQSNEFYAGATIAASTVVTARAGLRIDNAGLGAGASITNNYGLFIANQTAGSNNWALYSDGGLNQFLGPVLISGNVGFYNTTPVARPTGVAVTAEGIHAALVTLGLITA